MIWKNTDEFEKLCIFYRNEKHDKSTVKNCTPKELDNLDEMNKFLETPNLVRLNHKLIENLNRPACNK